MSGLAILVLVCALAGLTPHEQAMNESRAAFNQFDLARAEAGFAQAAAVAATNSERALALVWLGAIRAENGDFAGARARFGDAVDLDAAVVVPDHLSPTITQLVEEARRHARAQQAAVRAQQAAAAGSADAADDAAALPSKPRWTLLSGGAVTALGVLAVGGGAMVGMQAITQRDVAASLEFQNDAVGEYKKAREGALWSNVLYGAGGVLVAAGSSLAIASLLGADGP